MEKSSYIIKGGKQGSDRLKVMANATWPTSERFLRYAGMKPGSRVLDVGCGNGEIAKRYAVSILESNGKVVGIDCDDTKVTDAEETLAASEIDAVFRKADLENDSFEDIGKFDIIYARFILSHLKDPVGFLRKLSQSLNPGGKILIEDVDFDGHTSYPQNDEFDRYVEAYKEMGKKRGVDPLIGRKLTTYLREASYSITELDCVCPAFVEGDGKMMAEITFDLISDGLEKMGVLSPEERQATKNGLTEFTKRPDSLMTLPRIFQVAAQLN